MATKESKTGAGDKLTNAGNKISSIGDKMTQGITVPAILFVIGLMFLPLGIIAWVVGLLVFISTWMPAKKK